jgi:hypothetical protein
MTLPNFLIVGAAKAGTTSLYQYLKAHPQIYMSSVKEPRFFGLVGEKPNFKGVGDEKVNSTLITDPEIYQKLFQGVSREKAVGEASTWYLYSEKAPVQIQHYIPNAKLIAVLRNPVDRAYSNFLHQRYRSSEEPLADFAQALEAEEFRIQNNWRPFWHYKNMGFYSVQLNRYFQLFPASQIKVYLYEDLTHHPEKMLKDIFQFLEVDDNFLPNLSQKFYQSYRPKNRVLHSLVMRPNLLKSAFKSILPTQMKQYFGSNVRTLDRKINSAPLEAKLSQDLRKQLIQEYQEDIFKLQDLIQRDLSAWLTC